MAYITPRVKLELGARGDPWPTEDRVIRPYAADDYPDFFENPDCTVTVLSARRTFWEKATALHAEAHRPRDSPTPQYFSRHYYDIAMLLDSEDGKAGATDFKLLEQVAKHKAVFVRSGWASYDTARPGTLRLMPADPRIKDLRADYRDMAPMMFDEKPLPFDEILDRLQKLQDAISRIVFRRWSVRPHMAVFSQDQLEAIAGALGDTTHGLTGPEIQHLLASSNMTDPGPTTKRIRVYNAFVESQTTKQNRTHVTGIHPSGHEARAL